MPSRNEALSLTRRDFVRGTAGLGLAGSALLATGSCRGFNPGGQSSSGRLSLTWWGEGKRSQRTVDVTKLFEKQHQGVRINSQPTSYDGYYDKLTTRVAGGNPPDIFQLHVTTMADYATRGALMDLSELWSNQLGLANVPDKTRAACILDGKVYFIPLGVATQPACIYNRTLLEDLGVDEPRPGWTIDDFRKYAQDVWKASDGKVHGAADMGGSDTTLQAFVRSKGMDFFTKDGKLGFGEDALEEWFTMWDELRKSKACVPPETSASVTGFQNNPLVTKKTAMTNAASSKGVTGYANLLSDELRIAGFPKDKADGPQGTVVGPVEWWSFRAGLEEEQVKTAARFSNFYLTDPQAVAIMKVTHGVPIFPDLREQRQDKANELAAIIYDNVQDIEKQDPDPLSIYPAGASELVEDRLEETNEQIGFGQTQIKTAVSRFFEEADRILGS